MKYFLWLAVLSLLIMTTACSKKKEPAPAQQPSQTDSVPKSKYGKAMRAAENVTGQCEKNSEEANAMMDE